MKTRISEQDEFLLSQLLDGDLPPAMAQTLRERMDREPALKAAYQSMERIQSLVSRQTPAAHTYHDWAGLQNRVMEAVRQESQESRSHRQVIRFPMWMRVAIPLAAAAAIALLVSVHPLGQTPTAPDITSVARHEPVSPNTPAAHESTPEPMMVAFHRPQESIATAVSVRYGRSDQLEKQYRELDRKRANQPASFTYTMHADARPARDEFLDAM